MATIFLIAGHSLTDPGAVANNTTESKEVLKLQKVLQKALQKVGFTVKCDPPNMNLRETIAWIRQYAVYEDVVLDLHLNAATPAATGTEVFVQRIYGALEMEVAHQLVTRTSETLGIANRGVKLETQTRHGRLGVLHSGVHCSFLLEACFLTNKHDLKALRKNSKQLADNLADTLGHYFLTNYHSEHHRAKAV